MYKRHYLNLWFPFFLWKRQWRHSGGHVSCKPGRGSHRIQRQCTQPKEVSIPDSTPFCKPLFPQDMHNPMPQEGVHAGP